jgi:CDP-diacylglycerol--glycerol-3-phosphate 3-phosphatidyltransferase
MLSDNSTSHFLAIFIFLIAASTDWLDGYIARKRNEVTDWGKIADPLVDRLLILSAIAILYIRAREYVSIWLLGLAAGRDVIVLVGSVFLLLKQSTIEVSNLGKISTLALMTSFLILIFGVDVGLVWLTDVGRWLFYLAVLLSVVSGLDYLRWGRKKLTV